MKEEEGEEVEEANREMSSRCLTLACTQWRIQGFSVGDFRQLSIRLTNDPIVTAYIRAQGPVIIAFLIIIKYSTGQLHPLYVNNV